jgi:hypothetical protein
LDRLDRRQFSGSADECRTSAAAFYERDVPIAIQFATAVAIYPAVSTFQFGHEGLQKRRYSPDLQVRLVTERPRAVARLTEA